MMPSRVRCLVVGAVLCLCIVTVSSLQRHHLDSRRNGLRARYSDYDTHNSQERSVQNSVSESFASSTDDTESEMENLERLADLVADTDADEVHKHSRDLYLSPMKAFNQLMAEKTGQARHSDDEANFQRDDDSEDTSSFESNNRDADLSSESLRFKEMQRAPQQQQRKVLGTSATQRAAARKMQEKFLTKREKEQLVGEQAVKQKAQMRDDEDYNDQRDATLDAMGALEVVPPDNVVDPYLFDDNGFRWDRHMAKRKHTAYRDDVFELEEQHEEFSQPDPQRSAKQRASKRLMQQLDALSVELERYRVAHPPGKHTRGKNAKIAAINARLSTLLSTVLTYLREHQEPQGTNGVIEAEAIEHLHPHLSEPTCQPIIPMCNTARRVCYATTTSHQRCDDGYAQCFTLQQQVCPVLEHFVTRHEVPYQAPQYEEPTLHKTSGPATADFYVEPRVRHKRGFLPPALVRKHKGAMDNPYKIRALPVYQEPPAESSIARFAPPEHTQPQPEESTESTQEESSDTAEETESESTAPAVAVAPRPTVGSVYANDTSIVAYRPLLQKPKPTQQQSNGAPAKPTVQQNTSSAAPKAPTASQNRSDAEAAPIANSTQAAQQAGKPTVTVTDPAVRAAKLQAALAQAALKRKMEAEAEAMAQANERKVKDALNQARNNALSEQDEKAQAQREADSAKEAAVKSAERQKRDADEQKQKQAKSQVAESVLNGAKLPRPAAPAPASKPAQAPKPQAKPQGQQTGSAAKGAAQQTKPAAPSGTQSKAAPGAATKQQAPAATKPAPQTQSQSKAGATKSSASG